MKKVKVSPTGGPASCDQLEGWCSSFFKKDFLKSEQP